jgi:para-aminobenzoate synthetase component 1
MGKTLHLEEISYCPDSCELFDRIRDLPGAAFFDSAYPHSRAGRFDILTACPLNVMLPELAAGASAEQCKAFFAEMAEFHLEHYRGIQPATQDIPFCGGILGYIDYDAGSGLNSLPAHPGLSPSAPLSVVHLQAYQWAIIQDHLLKKSVLVALPDVSVRTRTDLLRKLAQPGAQQQQSFELAAAFTSNFSERQYKTAFDKIQAYIQAGDCYQVNLAQRFSAPFSGDPWSAYGALRTAAAAPFSAYMRLADNSAVMSVSPERFISLHGQRVETSPIKGTRPRHKDHKADEMAATELRESEKDRAENLMIVDLLRNDLGRSCVPGSIHVDRLFELQSFPTVHHLVSTISGELQPQRSAWELLRDSFPGGSITGAPKRRAMEIITELEPDPRQVYCGSMLYVSADGRMDSNIAIRTLLCDDQNIHCWGGGGIVADSQWQLEYRETYDKVGQFLQLLEGM